MIAGAAHRHSATVLGNVVADLEPEADAAPAPGQAEQDRQHSAAAEPAAGAPSAEPAGTGTTAQVVEFAVRAAPAAAAGPTSGPEDDEPAGPAAVVEEPATGDRPAVPGEDPAGPRPSGRRRAHSGPNKRELRHQQTREAIVDAAAALFAEHGFDAVSVMQIARRAGVVEKTVFNHFPVKEGLVFEADPPMRAALLDTVRHRPAGESVAAAAGGFLVAAISQLGSPAAATGVAEMARVVRGSRTLQAREREILGTLTEALAEQITAETRPAAGELEPWLAANAILGLYSALLELARDRVLAGAAGPELVEELRTRGQRGLALLQFGLAGYAKRR